MEISVGVCPTTQLRYVNQDQLIDIKHPINLRIKQDDISQTESMPSMTNNKPVISVASMSVPSYATAYTVQSIQQTSDTRFDWSNNCKTATIAS